MSAAPTWVLLRGLTRDSRHWGAFAEVLRAALGGAPLLMLDLPGNGLRNAERSPARVEAMADDVRVQLQQRGIAPPYRLLAMSLGAMVATAWLTRRPQDIDAAVLINTSMRPFSRFHQRLRPQVYAPLLKLALRYDDARAAEQLILRWTSRQRLRTAIVLDDWTRWRRTHPVSRGNALRQLAAAARFRAPLLPPPARVLLLASTQDELVDVQCSRRLAAAWQLPLIEHALAGHDLPLDDPQWLAARVREWIAD